MELPEESKGSVRKVLVEWTNVIQDPLSAAKHFANRNQQRQENVVDCWISHFCHLAEMLVFYRVMLQICPSLQIRSGIWWVCCYPALLICCGTLRKEGGSDVTYFFVSYRGETNCPLDKTANAQL